MAVHQFRLFLFGYFCKLLYVKFESDNLDAVVEILIQKNTASAAINFMKYKGTHDIFVLQSGL